MISSENGESNTLTYRKIDCNSPIVQVQRLDRNQDIQTFSLEDIQSLLASKDSEDKYPRSVLIRGSNFYWPISVEDYDALLADWVVYSKYKAR